MDEETYVVWLYFHVPDRVIQGPIDESNPHHGWHGDIEQHPGRRHIPRQPRLLGWVLFLLPQLGKPHPRSNCSEDEVSGRDELRQMRQIYEPEAALEVDDQVQDQVDDQDGCQDGPADCQEVRALREPWRCAEDEGPFAVRRGGPENAEAVVVSLELAGERFARDARVTHRAALSLLPSKRRHVCVRHRYRGKLAHGTLPARAHT
mmetsp:Transcript_82675/g.267662  ORF Transcript_82675/g.267662 Transcript_82675/m.267662 type:complete len:205 (+) Transcript_82675:571-1185(+)